MKNPFLLFTILLIVIVASACDSSRVFESYHQLNNEGWHKDSTIRFELEIGDTIASHNLYVNVRNKGNYPNSNLWLFLKIEAPNNEIIGDTVEFVLADHQGRWNGSGIGDLFDNQFLYRKNIYFPVKGSYEIDIKHGMRTTLLKGIQDIGIRIEKVN